MSPASDIAAPWSGVRSPTPPGIPSMISVEERSYLRWLTRDAWSGRGDIVEIGPWLGSSTWCLAQGMEENTRREPSARLHVVDTFRWREFMNERAPLDLERGESFRHVFEQGLSEKSDLLVIHEARLPEDSTGDIQWETPQRADEEDVPIFGTDRVSDDVAILFVDGAKSWRSMAFLLRGIAPRMAPGSLLVFQDYQNWASYWISMTIARLLELAPGSIAPEHALRWGTMSFSVKAPIPEASLQGLEDSIDEISTERGLALIDRGAEIAASLGGTRGAATVRLTGVSFVAAKEDWATARDRFRAVERTWPWRGGRESLDNSRGWLARRSGEPLPRSARTRLAEAMRRTVAAVRRALRPGGR